MILFTILMLGFSAKECADEGLPTQWVYSEELLNDQFMSSDTFQLKALDLAPMGESSVHLHLEYASVDACVRDSFKTGEDNLFDFLRHYGVIQKLETPVKLLGSMAYIWKVVASNNADVEVGSLWMGGMDLQSDLVVNSMEGFNAVPEIPDIRNFVSILGVSGLTAVASVEGVVQPKKGDVIYVSGAAGALGLIVVQLLKDEGAIVIGSAGSDAKVNYLKEIGVDHAFNYKTRSADDALKEFAPEGLDKYYDNVGGPTLEAAIMNMKTFGHIIASGMISQYGKSRNEQYGVRGMTQFVNKMIKMEGFILGGHPNMLLTPENISRWSERLMKLLEGENLKYNFQEYTWSEFWEGFSGLYEGKNTGKIVISGPKSNGGGQAEQ